MSGNPTYRALGGNRDKFGLRTMKFSHATTMNDLEEAVEENGFAVVSSCLDEGAVERLRYHLDETKHGQRNLLSLPTVRKLAKSKPVREIVNAILGQNCFAVKGILFNKTQESNWKVVWHQDLTISVRERREVGGFGPWTLKAKSRGNWSEVPLGEIHRYEMQFAL
jgi:hypothetical protein